MEEVIKQTDMRQNLLKKDSRPSSRTNNKADWVETTTIQPRQRPKPSHHPTQSNYKPHAASTPDVCRAALSALSKPGEQSLSHQGFDLLGISDSSAATASSSMTRSLDSGSGRLSSCHPLDSGSSNPFGDDFSKLTQFQLQGGGNSPASFTVGASTSTAGAPVSQQLTSNKSSLYPDLASLTSQVVNSYSSSC